MAIIYYNEYIGDDDYGNPMYREGSYDDGTVDTSEDTSATDADLAGGLLTPDALAAVLGKDNVNYTDWMKEAMTPEAQATIQKLISSRADPSIIGKLLSGFKKADGSYDWAKIATAGTGLYTMLKDQGDTGGYNVPVPKMDAVTQQIDYNDPNRRPGSAGRQYTTDPRYVKQGDATSLASAQAASDAQKAGILAAYKPAAAPPAVNPYAGQMAMKYNTPAPAATTPTGTASAGLPAIPTQQQLMDPNYKINSIGMADGGIAMAKGRYLDGDTDGMADKISTTIDGDQEAALSHGEFVIPADVVSHLGNGNSDAGAQKLYEMMDRIREARTGTKEQGKKINPDKFMPGGLAQAAKGFSKGGETTEQWAARQPDTSKITDSMERKNVLESWQRERPGYADPMDYKTYDEYAMAANPRNKEFGTGSGSELQNQANFYGMTLENYQNALSGDSTKPMGGNQAVYGSQLLSPLEQRAAEVARGQGISTMTPETLALAKANPDVFNAAARKFQNYMATTYPGTLEYQSLLSGPARYSSKGVENPELLDTVNMYIIDPRTGQIIKNPNYKKKMYAGGLAASKYAGGGTVQKFNEGGIPLDTSKTSTLSPWAGDYVTNMLGKTQALTEAPMQTYGGPLTAGASNLQQQGFAGISEVAKGGFNPTAFTSGTFDAGAANKYMNPYLSASLQPQIDEARRQSQITQQQNAGKMTQAGAFGGGRQAILDAETQRSLGANLAGITGAGYNKAYDAAMAQFNTEQGRGLDTQKATEASRQYSADFGLKSLNDLMSAGAAQRGIEGEGIAADKRQFEEQQARPYTNLEFQRKMLTDLPIGASTTSVNQDTLSKLQTDIGGLASLYQKLANLKLG